MAPWFSTTNDPLEPVPPTNVCTWVLWCRRTVQLRAAGGSGPSSGSVAEPWKFTVWPGSTDMPSAGRLIVGVGGALPTTMVTVALEEEPAVSVTVSFAANERTPVEVYVCDGLAAVEVAPSPKSHR